MTATTLLGTVSRALAAVHLERTVATDIETVWAAWTDPDRMARWLAPVASGTPGPSSTFVLQMDADEAVVCTATRWEPPRLLELTWDYPGEGSSRLRVELTATGDGTTALVLDHDRLDDADPVDYGAGWHVELEYLDAYLNGTAKPDFDERYAQLRPAYEAAAAV